MAQAMYVGLQVALGATTFMVAMLVIWSLIGGVGGIIERVTKG